MLSAKLSEDDVEEGMYDREEDDEEKDEGMHDDEEDPRREDDDEDEMDESEIIEIDGVKYAPVVSEEEHEDDEKEDDMEEELDLESVIKELESEINEEEGDDDDEEEEVTESEDGYEGESTNVEGNAQANHVGGSMDETFEIDDAISLEIKNNIPANFFLN